MNQKQPAFVYFIGGGAGLIKIGYSTNLIQRFDRIQTNCPVPLRVLACFEGSREDEAELHDQFRWYRSHAEWFNRTPGLIALIEEKRRAATWKALVHMDACHSVTRRRRPWLPAQVAA